MFVRFALIALLSTACTGSGRKPGSGARIVEPADGPWIAICTTEIVGPKRTEQRGVGEGRHQTRRQAHRMAVARACTRAAGGPKCQNLIDGWKVDKETCSRVDSEGRPARYRCRITVLRPPSERRATQRAEARTAKKACERARRKACKTLDGGVDCRKLEGEWESRETTGRRRPTSDRPGGRRLG